MGNTASRMVRIAKQTDKPKLSRGQQQFNQLIKKIENKRKLLAEWQEAIPIYHQRYHEELSPLDDEFDGHRKEMVHLLDRVYGQKTITKKERAKIKDIICSITAELLVKDEDESLKEMYNRYSSSDFDEETQMVNESAKSLIEDMLGIDLGDDDIDLQSPDLLMSKLAEKMKQREVEFEETQQQRASRKKSAKALAKEAKQEKEAQDISQSIREVYRKLASALHPDREQDPQERERKKILMQKANVAYDKKNLLQLLELQLEIEQIDASAISALSEDKLNHYNKVLSEQHRELESEIAGIEGSFAMRFNIHDYPLTPKRAMSGLATEILEIKQYIDELKEDLASFSDIKNIKHWLRTYVVPANPHFDEDMEFYF